MEESLKSLWTICIWFFGISTTITLCLFGWLMKLQSKITLGDSIDKDLKTIVGDLNEIKKAMVGDYDKKGLITRHHELEDRVKALELENRGK